MTTRKPSGYCTLTCFTCQDYPQVNFDSWDLNPTRYVDVQGSHGRIIREIGAASTILLKNEKNVLPLNYAKSLAVIGDDAGDNPGLVEISE